MTYDFECTSCTCHFEQVLKIGDRDEPTEKPCPECGGKVRRVFATPAISYQPVTSNVRRAGDGWNDVLTKIKTSHGKTSTIETR